MLVRLSDEGAQAAPVLPPEAPAPCRAELLLPSVLSKPLVLPFPAAAAAPAAACAAMASAAACALRVATEQGLRSAPLELLLRVALTGPARPPLLLGLLAPRDASSLYSRESSVMVRMCFGTGGQKCPGNALLAAWLHDKGDWGLGFESTCSVAAADVQQHVSQGTDHMPTCP